MVSSVSIFMILIITLSSFNVFGQAHCGRSSSAAPHVRISYGECRELVTERIEESKEKGENPMLSFNFVVGMRSK